MDLNRPSGVNQLSESEKLAANLCVPEFSIVIPVYNEAENIVPLLRSIESDVRGDYEILILYDFDEDTTLPAVRAMDPPIAKVRLVRNDIGRGVVNALRAGFAASQGWLGTVVTMGDLSDPPERINAMVQKLREGYDVVAGSRYMPGGKMIGGPWLKSNMSRAAGLVAKWLTGIGVHDVTTNFRAYSRRLLQECQVESKGGFELGLELTVKCHLRGWRVGQVPSEWRDRTAGESRFQLLKWLPGYLRWYLSLLLRDPLGIPTIFRRWSLRRVPQHFNYFGIYEKPGYGWMVGRSEPGVMVVATTPQDRVILIRTHRPYHRQGQTSWELPGGGQEDSETVAQAAARELFEETGYRAGSRIEVVDIPFQPVPGMAYYLHWLVCCHDCVPERTQDEEHEGIHEVREFAWEEVTSLIQSGQITALPTIAALSFVRLGSSQ